MIGAGRGNGEPHENFNAEFGPQGRVLQYMTRQNREVCMLKTSPGFCTLRPLLMKGDMRRQSALPLNNFASENMSLQGRIERGAHLATLDKALRLPAQLCRMEVRAQAAQTVAENEFCNVMDRLLDSGLTCLEVCLLLQFDLCSGLSSIHPSLSHPVSPTATGSTAAEFLLCCAFLLEFCFLVHIMLA